MIGTISTIFSKYLSKLFLENGLALKTCLLSLKTAAPAIMVYIEEGYENINQTIIDSNVMNLSLIVMGGNYDAIDADYYSCHGY